MLKVETKFLFLPLLGIKNPDIICDIGSMNARDSLRFRRFSPNSRIIAFEANPNNFRNIIDNKKVLQNKIEVVNKAVWKEDTNLYFNVPKLDSKKGTGSIKDRVIDKKGYDKIKSEAIRVDSFLKDLKNEKVALWIDVEGAGMEVILGASKIIEKVIIINIEVEKAQIWEGQNSDKSIIMLLHSWGFIPITSGTRSGVYDLLFIRRDDYESHKFLYLLAILSALSFHAFITIFYKRLKKFLRALHLINH